MENIWIEKLNELFEELVPSAGPAETKAGELVRAVSRIGYRFYNDGDKIGVGYGNETCNSAARFITTVYDGEDFAATVAGMWGLTSDRFYEAGLYLLVEQVVKFLEAHPELKEQENEDDFPFDYSNSLDANWDQEEEVEEEPWAVYDPEPAWEED